MQTLKKLSLFAAILVAASVTAKPSDDAPRRHPRDAASAPGSDQLQSEKEGQPSTLPIKYDEPEGIQKFIEDFNHEYFPDADVNSKLKINEPVLKPEQIHEHHLSEDKQDMLNNAQLQYITLPLGVNANDALMAAMNSNQNPIIGYLQQYPSYLVKGANPQIKRQIIYQQTFITPFQQYQPNNQQQTSYQTQQPNQPQQQNLNQRQVYQTQPQNLQYIYNDLGRMSNVNYDAQVPQDRVNDASNQNFRSTSNSLPFLRQQYFNPNARKDTNYFPQNYIRFEQNAPPQRYPYRKFSGSRSYMTLPQNIPLENSNQFTRSFNSNEDNGRLFTSLQPPSIQLVTYSNDQIPSKDSNVQNSNFNQESRNTPLTNGYNMNNVIANGFNMDNLRRNGFTLNSAQTMNGQALPFPPMTPYDGKDSSMAMVNSYSSLIEYGDPTDSYNSKPQEQKILNSVEAQSAPDGKKLETRHVGATDGNDITAEEERLGRIMTVPIRVGGTITSENKDSHRNVGGGTLVKHDVNKPQVGFVKFEDPHGNVEISRSVELELKDLLGQHQTRQLTLTGPEIIPQGSESKKVEVKTGKNTPKLSNDSPPTEGNVKEKDAEEITVRVSPNQHVIVMPVVKMDNMKSGNETSSLETLDEDDDDDSEDGDQPGDDDEDEDDAKKPDVEIAFEEKPDKPRKGGDVDANNNDDDDNENIDNNSNNPIPKQPVILTTQGGSAPESGPVIRRLVVRRGGVAIAGPGGIATAGPGGVAVVGPGGTAYTEPNGVAIVGPGGKVVSLPADTLFNQGGIAVAHPDGSEPRLTKDYFPPGAKIVAYGPTVYFHRVEPETI